VRGAILLAAGVVAAVLVLRALVKELVESEEWIVKALAAVIARAAMID
jgi:hypothetical protein